MFKMPPVQPAATQEASVSRKRKATSPVKEVPDTKRQAAADNNGEGGPRSVQVLSWKACAELHINCAWPEVMCFAVRMRRVGSRWQRSWAGQSQIA